MGERNSLLLQRNSNGGAYPPFSRFSKIVREQARIKNDPNVLAGKAANPT